MDIIIDVISTYGKITGVGQYTLYVTNHLISDFPNHDYYYITPSGVRRAFLLKKEKVGSMFIDKVKKSKLLKILVRAFWIKLSELRTREKFDVYFEPNFVPLDIKTRKLVVTVHDLSFLLFPQWHPEDRVKYITEGFFKKTLKADRIITPSNYIKREIEDMFPFLKGRVSAIHLGVDRRLFNPEDYYPSLKTPEKFILFVGSIEPRKNLKNLLKAYNALSENIRREFPLLLAGFNGWKNEEIMELIMRSERYIRYVGYINDKILAELYRRASVFIYPSYYEGFGLPPVEAMACGAPVIVTNRASLPEVCGDAALYIQNPDDVEEIAHVLEKVLLDESLREELRQKGLQRAKLYDWEKTAREHYKIITK